MNQLHSVLSVDKNKNSASIIVSETEMKIFAKELAKRVHYFSLGGKIIFCDGEVGSGKTTFTRYFSEYFGIISNSPTYSIIEQRKSEKKIDNKNKNENFTIVHGDFYRTDEMRSEEIIEEYLEILSDEKSIGIFEWLDDTLKTELFSHQPSISLFFSHGENREKRKIDISFSNPFSCSIDTAKQLQEEYKTPVHVKHHIEMVRNIAMFCGEKLQKNNIPIDMELVESGALLHDAVRYVDFPEFTEEHRKYYAENITPEKINIWKKYQKIYKTQHHAHAMQNILHQLGFPATGKVVASHYTGEIYRNKHFSWEEKCVYYADKRALHSSFVTVQERLIDGAKRYPHEKIKGNNLLDLILDFEKDLQEKGKWKEEDIQKNIRK